MEFYRSTIPKRVFTHEYRAEAVKLVTEQAMEISKAANKLGLSVKTYSRWVRDARAGTLVGLDTYRTQPVTDFQAEVSRLKRELAIACEERDILKKATVPWLGRAVAALRSSPSEVRVHPGEIG
jgi:transposase